MTDINYTLLTGFIAAEELLRNIRISVVNKNHFAWSKLDRVSEYVKTSQRKLGNAYFSQPEIEIVLTIDPVSGKYHSEVVA